VIMCFFHCPGSNGTTTCYCRETDNVANTRFLGHFCTPTMLHLRAFVANQVLSPIRAYFGLFCPDFYSDIADFTQIFCRYLPKKLVAKTSAFGTQRPSAKNTFTDGLPDDKRAELFYLEIIESCTDLTTFGGQACGCFSSKISWR